MEFNCVWGDPPNDIILEENNLHAWCVSLEQPTSRIQSLAHILSEKERTRAERFHFERDRRRYIVSQGCLRMLLGQYLDIQPEQVEFSYGSRGKPALKESGSTEAETTGLRFNTSHSHELALYGIAKNREVGIDIEYIRQVPDAEQIVERFFSLQERAAFRSLPPNQKIEGFFNCWTRKEAYIKARGEGLYRPLDQFAVSLVPGEPARLIHFEEDPQEITRWSLRPLNPAPGYVGAVVVEGHSWQLTCWRML